RRPASAARRGREGEEEGGPRNTRKTQKKTEEVALECGARHRFHLLFWIRSAGRKKEKVQSGAEHHTPNLSSASSVLFRVFPRFRGPLAGLPLPLPRQAGADDVGGEGGAAADVAVLVAAGGVLEGRQGGLVGDQPQGAGGGLTHLRAALLLQRP